MFILRISITEIYDQPNWRWWCQPLAKYYSCFLFKYCNIISRWWPYPSKYICCRKLIVWKSVRFRRQSSIWKIGCSWPMHSFVSDVENLHEESLGYCMCIWNWYKKNSRICLHRPFQTLFLHLHHYFGISQHHVPYTYNSSIEK